MYCVKGPDLSRTFRPAKVCHVWGKITGPRCWRESSRLSCRDIPDRRVDRIYTRRVTRKISSVTRIACCTCARAYRLAYFFIERTREIERFRGASSSAETRESAFKAPVGQGIALKSPVSVTEIAKIANNRHCKTGIFKIHLVCLQH